MTFQSFPNRPLVWLDDPAHKNPFGVQPLKANYIRHETVLPAGHEAHSTWKADAHRLALAKVQNTKYCERAMLKGPPSIKGVRPVLSQRHIYGGAMTSEGQRMVGDLLKDRISQYNDIASASFEGVTPERLSTNITLPDTYQLDSLFSNLLSSIDDGVITLALITMANSIANTIATTGDKIPTSKLAEYAQVIIETNDLIIDTLEKSSFIETPKNKHILGNVLHIFQELWKFIKKMEAYSSAPSKTRSIALAGERAKLLTRIRQGITVNPNRPAPEMPLTIPAPGWESTVAEMPLTIPATGWESTVGSGYRRRH